MWLLKRKEIPSPQAEVGWLSWQDGNRKGIISENRKPEGIQVDGRKAEMDRSAFQPIGTAVKHN